MRVTRLVGLILLGVTLSACVSESERQAEDRAACQAIGFIAGTDAFRDCLLRLAVARRTHTSHKW